MANKTLVITLSTPRSIADLAGFLKSTTDPRGECRALEHLFSRIGAGDEKGGGISFDVQTSASPPVRASGTYTLAFASIANSDTVTVAGTVLTCVTGTPTAGQFKKVTDGPTTAANFAAAVNVNTTINKLVSATNTTSGVGVVTITALTPGVIGNKLTIATSNGTGFVVSAATLASGTGGAETLALTYARG